MRSLGIFFGLGTSQALGFFTYVMPTRWVQWSRRYGTTKNYSSHEENQRRCNNKEFNNIPSSYLMVAFLGEKNVGIGGNIFIDQMTAFISLKMQSIV
jgi:hypothetical protein